MAWVEPCENSKTLKMFCSTFVWCCGWVLRPEATSKQNLYKKEKYFDFIISFICNLRQKTSTLLLPFCWHTWYCHRAKTTFGATTFGKLFRFFFVGILRLGLAQYGRLRVMGVQDYSWAQRPHPNKIFVKRRKLLTLSKVTKCPRLTEYTLDEHAGYDTGSRWPLHCVLHVTLLTVLTLSRRSGVVLVGVDQSTEAWAELIT